MRQTKFKGYYFTWLHSVYYGGPQAAVRETAPRSGVIFGGIRASACGSSEPRSSPPPHRGGLLSHSCRHRRTAAQPSPSAMPIFIFGTRPAENATMRMQLLASARRGCGPRSSDELQNAFRHSTSHRFTNGEMNGISNGNNSVCDADPRLKSRWHDALFLLRYLLSVQKVTPKTAAVKRFRGRPWRLR